MAGPREHGFRRTGKSDIRRGPSWRGGEELVGEGTGRRQKFLEIVELLRYRTRYFVF